MMSGPTWMTLSIVASFLRFVADPNQRTSVFFVFSWKSFDAHQFPTSAKQAPSLTATSQTLDGLPCLVPCMSSANRWWRTWCCLKTSATSSAYVAKDFYPRTDPCGVPIWSLMMRGVGALAVDERIRSPFFVSWSANCYGECTISASLAGWSRIRSRDYNILESRPQAFVCRTGKLGRILKKLHERPWVASESNVWSCIWH